MVLNNATNKGVPEQNIIYVGKHGDNDNDGTTIQNAKATIGAAILIASGSPTIMVMPGTYTEDLSVTVPLDIVSQDPINTFIVGKITVAHSSGVVSIKDIGISKLNDHVIEFNAPTVTPILSLQRCYMLNTWNTGSGQTVFTSKAALKVTGGSFRQIGGYTTITTSGDNTEEHNTSAYWVTGSTQITFESLGAENIITNTTDASQNLEVLFHNNTNSNSQVLIQNGRNAFTGVVSGTNYLAPFYNHTDSAGMEIIEGNVIKLTNTGEAFCAFNFSSSVDCTFSNNSIFPENVSSLYVANEYSGSGSINCINCYFNRSTLPSVNGDVDYTITLDNGNFYTNGQATISGLEYPTTDGAAGTAIITDGSGNLSFGGLRLPYVEITSTTQAMNPNNSYGANNASGIAFALPATSAVGDIIEITGIDGIWSITQGVGKTIYVGDTNTTTGITGSITADDEGDCITLKCISSDSDWRVTSLIGSLTVV